MTIPVTARANRILGSLKKAFVNRDSHLSKNLYFFILFFIFKHIWTDNYKKFKLIKLKLIIILMYCKKQFYDSLYNQKED